MKPLERNYSTRRGASTRLEGLRYLRSMGLGAIVHHDILLSSRIQSRFRLEIWKKLRFFFLGAPEGEVDLSIIE